MESRRARSTGICSTIRRIAGVQRLVRDLNRLYRRRAGAASARLRAGAGFGWLIGDDRANSVFAFLRRGDGRRAAGPGRLQHDAGAAPRLSHRRAARRPLARDRSTPIRSSTAAANMGNGGGVARARADARRTARPHSRRCSTLPPLADASMLRRRRTEAWRAVPDRLLPGLPYPLGATWDGLGVNFAVFSANAQQIELCLFDPAGAARDRSASTLPECTDEVWHGYLPDARPACSTAFARTVRMSRSMGIASTRTSCCSIRMRAHSSASFAGPMRCSAIA